MPVLNPSAPPCDDCCQRHHHYASSPERRLRECLQAMSEALSILEVEVKKLRTAGVNRDPKLGNHRITGG